MARMTRGMFQKTFVTESVFYVVGKETVRKETLSVWLYIWILLTCAIFGQSSSVHGGLSQSAVAPAIQDFYINNTWANRPCQFSFFVTDESSLNHAIFGCNITSSFVNSSAMALLGNAAWANYTYVLPSFGCVITFQFWVWGSESPIPATTGLRYIRVQVYNSSSGWNPPYDSLINAIQSLDSANAWSKADVYSQTILSKKGIDDLASLIDNYAAVGDWMNVLKWSAYCQKLGIIRHEAIVNALGNYTMVGNLPFTLLGPDGRDAFSPEHRWSLYGFYWAEQYGVSLSKWNVSAAYEQFNSSVYYSVNHQPHGLPLWIYSDNTGKTFTNRYYDEDACTVSSYLIFYRLLNVSDALNQALVWWNYTNTIHWNAASQYFTYLPNGGSDEYECEAGSFVKIARELQYLASDLPGWNNVLTDMQNRFLLNGWNSAQWLDSSKDLTTNVVVHEYKGNPQRRLQNTFAAWQVLLGIYQRLGDEYQNKMAQMLCGDDTTLPAWDLLLNPFAGLYDNETQLFGWMVTPSSNVTVDCSATAYAEILLFMMGIVPRTATLALPVEELNYEYIQDLDCRTFSLNLSGHTITIPVSNSGDLTFQYGDSPITWTFGMAGVYELLFSDSWNTIVSVEYKSPLSEEPVYYGSHAIAVTDVQPLKTVVGLKYSLDINVSIMNAGDFSETFDVFVWINASYCLPSKTVSLNNDASKTITFEWNTNTTSFSFGNYSISAFAEPVQGEIDTDDNNLTCPIMIHIGIPGDVSGQQIRVYDGICNMRDISEIVHTFGTVPGDPHWNANDDINNDHTIDMRDLGIVISDFGKHYP